MKLLKNLALFGVVGGVLAGATYTIKAAPQGGITGGATGMSQEELIVRVHTIGDQIVADARHIHHLQAVARKEKDIIKLNCVNDKLVQVKPQMNIADQAKLTLDIAASGEQRGSAFQTLSTAAEAIRHLREEADACIGEPILGTESSNGFTGPTVPDSPYGNPFGPGVEPPGYASPFN